MRLLLISALCCAFISCGPRAHKIKNMTGYEIWVCSEFGQLRCPPGETVSIHGDYYLSGEPHLSAYSSCFHHGGTVYVRESERTYFVVAK